MVQRLSWDLVEESYVAYNSDGLCCGWLESERVGAHTHWCWNQKENISMSPGCLQEVRDKQKELFHMRCKRYRTYELK